MREILEEEDSLFVHGYMSNAGYEDVRGGPVSNRRFDTSFSQSNILMTVGMGQRPECDFKDSAEPR